MSDQKYVWMKNTIVARQESADFIDKPKTRNALSHIDDIDTDAIKRASIVKPDAGNMVMLPYTAYIPNGNIEITDEGPKLCPEYIETVTPDAGFGFGNIPMFVDSQPEPSDFYWDRTPAIGDIIDAINNPMKEKEYVLAIAARPFLNACYIHSDEDSINGINIIDYSFHWNRYFVRRGWAEKDPRFLQVLPYVVYYKVIDGEYYIFTYMRGGKAGEHRLSGNCSIGVGGHINPHDVLTTISIDPTCEYLDGNETIVSMPMMKSIYNAILRESDEEVSVSGSSHDRKNSFGHFIDYEVGNTFHDFHDRFAFFLDYSGNDVNKVHLGAFTAVKLPEEVNLTMKEDSLIQVGFKKLSDLVTGNDIPTPLESWSQSIADSLHSTIEFLKEYEVKGIRNDFLYYLRGRDMEHHIRPETARHIKPEDRWKVGTLASIFDVKYKFYCTNVFLKV